MTTQFFKDNGKKFIKVHNATSISIEDLFKAFAERIEQEQYRIEPVTDAIGSINIVSTHDASVIELTDIVKEDTKKLNIRK